MNKAIVELILGFTKAVIKPITGFFALLIARRVGKMEAEKASLEEHAKEVQKANAARIDGELTGLRDDDYRD